MCLRAQRGLPGGAQILVGGPCCVRVCVCGCVWLCVWLWLCVGVFVCGRVWVGGTVWVEVGRLGWVDHCGYVCVLL